MTLIQCTKKLLDELSIGKEKTEFSRGSDDNGVSLGDWHANLIKVNREKLVLFTHDKTLYSFFVPGFSKSDVQEIESVFMRHLNLNLMNEGLGRYKIRIRKEYEGYLTFTKSSSRSVLSSMTNIVEIFLIHRFQETDLKNIDYLKINSLINKTPFSACGYKLPIEGITEKLKKLWL